MKLKLVFIILLFFGRNGFAQITFDLKNSQLKLQKTDFQVVEVSDLRPIKNDFIGEIYISDEKTERVKINKGIEKGLLAYYNSKIIPYKQQETQLKIEINNLSISEYRISNNKIEGKIKYDITAFTIGTNGTKPLCNSRNSGQYTRNLSSATILNIQTQLQVSLDNGLNFIQQYIQKNKVKLEVFATQSQVTIKPFSFKPNKDTVYYQERKVTWNDFLGQARSQSRYGAAIYSSFGINSKMFVENGTIKIEVTPTVFTDKNMSWAKSEIKNEYNLKHEQLHFDVCYLMALKFLKTIKILKAESLDDLSSMIQYEYLEFYKKTHELQEQYDTETNHSIFKEQQQKWDLQITKEIKEFDLKEIFN